MLTACSATKMIYAISPAYMAPSTVAWSLMRFQETAGYLSTDHLIVDNYWPFFPDDRRPDLLREAAAVVAGAVIQPPGGKNIGGHGAFNYALSQLPLEDHDLVLCYDPDSNPVDFGWINAMYDAHVADKTLGAISLMPAWLVNRREWATKNLAGYKVAHHDKPDMWNVTMFKYSALKKTGGLLADTEFYGHVERAMFREFAKHELWHGYLYDYREDTCPIPHPKKYQDWKGLHSSKLYLKNFDDYLKENR